MVPKTVRIRRKYFSDLVGSQKGKNFFHLWLNPDQQYVIMYMLYDKELVTIHSRQNILQVTKLNRSRCPSPSRSSSRSSSSGRSIWSSSLRWQSCCSDWSWLRWCCFSRCCTGARWRLSSQWSLESKVKSDNLDKCWAKKFPTSTVEKYFTTLGLQMLDAWKLVSFVYTWQWNWRHLSLD